jgi:hypothetical protein
MSRLAIVILTAFLGGALATSTAACSGPWSGKPEKLKKPRKKKRPKEEKPPEQVAEDIEVIEKCRTDFFGDEYKKRRRAKESRKMAKQADALLIEAEQTEGPRRIPIVTEALGTLENALKKDPYGPEATYKMAVAYALVGRKGCALALLERLAELQKHPDVENEAYRMVQRAVRDQSFANFEQDAKKALGE